jgi:hypothetical protein
MALCAPACGSCGDNRGLGREAGPRGKGGDARFPRSYASQGGISETRRSNRPLRIAPLHLFDCQGDVGLCRPRAPRLSGVTDFPCSSRKSTWERRVAGWTGGQPGAVCALRRCGGTIPQVFVPIGITAAQSGNTAVVLPLSNYSAKTLMAERGGFEPPVRLPVHTVSNRAP